MSKRSRAKAKAKARRAAEAKKHQAQPKTEEDQAKIAQYLADKRAAQDAAQATQAATAAAQKQAAEAAEAAEAAQTAAEAAETAEAAQTAAEAAEAEQWLTTKETLALTQISRTSMHLKTKAGTFPQAIKIGKKCVWVKSEIIEWMNCVTYRYSIK